MRTLVIAAPIAALALAACDTKDAGPGPTQEGPTFFLDFIVQNRHALLVARRKEFDRDEVLRRAIPVFWEKGFAGTSTEDLVRAMGIGRQSLYDTFGDKRRLFLEALRAYNADSIAAVTKKLRAGPTALAAIERVLVDLAEARDRARSLGCMGVNAVCELARDDDEVRALTATSAALLEAVLKDAIDEAQSKGDVCRAIDSRAAARFLAATLSGMKVQAKAGANAEALRDVAAFAVQSLRPR
ncbi:TetR/AcrR family transcriptional regulator [Sorangium sp. So ce1078]|uniref:TetR/AcrR family transcriptional regulator n=1 Tax=Sorangium sp. So ce1078 TaxID=3133329 RepID=UPI003F6349FB